MFNRSTAPSTQQGIQQGLSRRELLKILGATTMVLSGGALLSACAPAAPAAPPKVGKKPDLQEKILVTQAERAQPAIGSRALQEQLARCFGALG